MHLVDDVNAVFPDLGRYAHLVDKVFDVINAVVGRRIHFEDAVRASFGEGYAGFALSAGLPVGGRMLAVDHFGENPRGCCLADSARAAEKVGVGQLAAAYGVLESLRDIVLADERSERFRPVFAC